MITLETPILAAINHLLEAEPWAHERLTPFVGELLELRVAPLPAMRIAIAEGGRVEAARPGEPSSLVIRVGPQALAALAKGEDYFMRAVDISGNARLASEIMFLLRHLRWDVEEDLSRLFGDVAAHRMVAITRQLTAWQADAARRAVDNVMEYVIEEKRLLTRRADLDGFAAQTAQLRDALERLDKRIQRLAARRGT